MDDDIILRKQAVELHLKGLSKSDIAVKIGRSRQWVHKWLNRYHEVGGESWFESLSNAPENISRKTAEDIESLVISIRKTLDGRKYAQKGALSIMYELNQMGVPSPSIATINRILKRHGLVGQSMSKMVKKRIIQIILPLFSRWIWSGQSTLQGASVFTFWMLLRRKTIMQAFILCLTSLQSLLQQHS
jgi:transposase